ncbi:MAG: hypothetical protein ABSF70_12710 [Terracidiphilus sp.]|jgi:hypothetical protein
MRFTESKKSYGIDLDADPVFVPNGFEVVEHRKGGFVAWTPHKPQFELYLPESQRKGIVEGAKVLEELEKFDGTIVNANALDFLIDHVVDFPWIIPDAWKNVDLQRTKHILFWGTKYLYDGSLCVRSLDWSADARERVWRSGYCWIENRLNSQFPAAMMRKPAPVASS